MLKLAALLGFLIFWFGFAGPACISAPSTELVLGWILCSVALFIAAVEAYSKKHDLEPSGGEDACGLTFDGPGTSISVRVRSRLGWAVYTLDRLD